jgi:hypothetical protein
MFAPIQLTQIINRKNLQYTEVLKNISTKLKPGKYDLCFYISVRNRLHFFEPFYAYFQEARKKSKLKIKLVVIENDKTCTYSNAVQDKDVEFIYIPSDISKSGGNFAKSLCYNIGFIKNQTVPYHVFHDLDILIDDIYFNQIEYYINQGITWLQPYSGKRVMRVGSNATEEIVKNPIKIKILSGLKDMRPSNPGSPGGSILVKRDDFIKIGGYDPELFYGYSPEDSFFWTKLEVLYGAKGVFDTHFQGKAVYADKPCMDVYHLDHPSAETSNPHLGGMVEVMMSFNIYSDSDRQSILELKKNKLMEGLNNG